MKLNLRYSYTSSAYFAFYMRLYYWGERAKSLPPAKETVTLNLIFAIGTDLL